MWEILWYPSRNKLIQPAVGLIILLSLVTAGYAQPLEPVGWWALDETEGLTAFDSAGTNDGLLAGNPLWDDGYIGGALNCDGDGDYVEINPDSNLDVSYITMAAWVKLDSDADPANLAFILNRQMTEGGTYALFINTNLWIARVRLDNYESADVLVYSDEEVTTNWTHVAAVYNGTDLRLYINGALQSNVNVVLGSLDTDNPGPLTIGSHPTVGCYFDGLIDDVRIYNQALSASEIAELISVSQKALWTFDTDAGDDIGDNHGVLINGAHITHDPNQIWNGSGALLLDGIDDFVEINPDENLDVDRITMAAWVKLDSDADTVNPISILNRQMTEAGTYALFINDRRWRARIRLNGNEAADILVESNRYVTWNWTHVAATYDGDELKLYINGMLQNNSFLTTGRIDPDNPGPLTIGSHPSGGWNFKGVIDDVRIYDGALSPEEIRDLADLWPGSGTEADPYQIWTPEDMQMIGAYSECWDRHFILMADIDLSAYTGETFNTIGSRGSGKGFLGVFDGNGHVISNYSWQNDEGSHEPGIFALVGYFSTPGGEIKNLGLINVNMDVGSFRYVGALAGINCGTITNCYATGKLLRRAYPDSLSYPNGFIGGLVGNNNGTITECFTAMDVDATLYSEYIGGLAGFNYGEISNSYSMGSVFGSTYVGGLLGGGGTLTNCYAVGKVNGIIAGGLVGRSGGTFISCFWDMDSNPNMTGIGEVDDPDGVTGKTTAELMTQSTFTDAGWDFVDTWEMCDGVYFPRLAGQLPDYNDLIVYHDSDIYYELPPAENISFNVTITNSEILSITDSFETSVYISDSATIDWDSLGPESQVGSSIVLGPLDGCSSYTQNLTIPIPAQEGLYFIKVKTDALGEVTEFNEFNNWSNIIVLVVDECYAEGRSGSSNPIIISTPNQLYSLGLNENLWDKHIIMINDVDFPAIGDFGYWVNIHPNPIGYYNNETDYLGFSGTFDGLNHVIRYNLPEQAYISAASMFGCVSETGIVRNLGIEDFYINDDYQSLLVEFNLGYLNNCHIIGVIRSSADQPLSGMVRENLGHIQGCYTQLNMTISGSYYEVGGLIAINRGPVTNCYTTGTVSTYNNGYYIGGLVGLNYAGPILDCYSTCEINGKHRIGGLIGYNYSGEIINCYAQGNVTGRDEGNCIGGLIGLNEDRLINCYATGNVVVANGYHVGGLVGYNNNECINCYATGNVSGHYSIGGLVGTNSFESGTILYSHALGNISGSQYIGGLVGRENGGGVRGSYAWGDVFGNYDVGGLAGSGSNISECYATGLVEGNEDFGGLLGTGGNITSSFWDIQTSGIGITDGVGNVTSEPVEVYGKITSEMMMEATFTAAGWDFDKFWTIDEGVNYPTHQPRVDLIVDEDTVIIYRASAGENLDINIVLRNMGNAPAEADGSGLMTKLYLASSSDIDWDSLDDTDVVGECSVDILEAGMTYDNIVSLVCPPFEPGVYFLRAKVDTADAVEESNEDNNWSEVIALAVDYYYGGGDGSEENPYQIRTAEQMNTIGLIPLDWDKHFMLMNDISLKEFTGTTYNIIGYYSIENHIIGYYDISLGFTGTFHGMDHVIRDFTWTGSGIDYVGLFGFIDNEGTVSNFGMEKVDINAGSGDTMGCIAARNSGSIINCYSKGIIKGTFRVGGLVGHNRGFVLSCYADCTVEGNSSIGGLIGSNYGGLSYSYSHGSVTGNFDVGGLVGGYHSNYNSSIKYCHSLCNVTGGEQNTGGLIGYRTSSSSIDYSYAGGTVSGINQVGGFIGLNYGKILYCYSTGNVTGTGNQVGGFIGYDSSEYNIEKCFAAGNVAGNDQVGGFIGYNYENEEIRNCYALGEVTGNEYVGGFIGDNGGSIEYCFSKGFVNSQAAYVGGLIGDGNSYKVTASFWDMQTSQKSASAGGTGLYTVDMMQQITFESAGWDFIDIWTIDEGNSYPWLLGIGPEPGKYGGGSGTMDDPYQIWTAVQFHSLGLNREDWEMGKSFILMTDIDMSGYPGNENHPIGDGDDSFDGIFDGKDHVISNYSLIMEEESDVGIFGVLGSYGKIRNLGIRNVNINASNTAYVGGLAGFAYNSSIYNQYSIQNCFVTGMVKGSSSVGGLVGTLYNIIRNCYANVNVEGNDDYVGGLVGRNGHIIDCYASGNVSGNRYVGGLAGYAKVSNSYASCYVTGTGNYTGGLTGYNFDSISDSYAFGYVEGPDYVGGLTGYNRGDIINCYAYGQVVGTGVNTGGFAGLNSSEGMITVSFWDTLTSGMTVGVGTNSGDPVDLTGLETPLMQIAETFTAAGWDFMHETTNGTQDNWRMPYMTTGYPMLAWQKDIPGDSRGSYGVTLVDFYSFSAAWLTTPADPSWNPACNLAGDPNTINIEDITVFMQNWLIDPVSDSQVCARHIFYNNSSFDGDEPLANPDDDNAIAPDKTPLLPGETATFANYTSYSRGINGIMIDIYDLPGVPTETDFLFKVGNDNNPDSWTAAPAPADITIRPAPGLNDCDRITIIFPDNAIQKQWLQVTVLATPNTGLQDDDVFYVGNAIGETGNSTADASVNAIDIGLVRDNPSNFLNPAALGNTYDFDRDQNVNALDAGFARDNTSNFLTDLNLITVP
ncbi:MAG: hypothetical protein JW860_04560 [Sedimentisphaerales bacterium]|nr:hypothetical protein [Sedimentisphaerales bacterium]